MGEGRKPIHVAINTSNLSEWSEAKGVKCEDAAKLYVEKLDKLVDFQLSNSIPIMSVKVLHKANCLEPELTEYFLKLAEDPRVHDNKTRVFIIGRWYDLDPSLVSSLKKVMEKTKDYDENFLNFCIAYDGQEEITSAVKVISRQVETGKIIAESVDEDMIKQHLSSSYFPPPDLIIESSRVYSGLLLWDAKNAVLKFTNKLWMKVTEKDLEKALEFYKEKKE